MRGILFTLLFGIIALILLLPLSFDNQYQVPPVQAQDDDDRYVTGAFPRAMAFDGQRVWVANWQENTISRLDARTGQVLDTLSSFTNTDITTQGRRPRINLQRPTALAWDGRYMWIANFQDNTVFAVNTADEVIKVFDDSRIDGPAVLLWDTAHIWIANQRTPDEQEVGTVIKIDVNTNTFNSFGPFPVGLMPTAMAWDGENIWVANGNSDTLSVLDNATGQTVGEVRVMGFPLSLAFDGAYIWVSHYDGTVMLVRNSTLEVQEELTINVLPGEADPQRPIQLLYVFGHIWITNAHIDGFTAFRAQTRIDIGVIDTNSEFPAAITSTNDQIWVANWLGSTITVYDPEGNVLVYDGQTVGERDNLDSTAVAFDRSVLRSSPTPLPTATPTLLPTAEPCASILPSRFELGMQGIINSTYGNLPLRLRSTPGTDDAVNIILATYPAGTEFEVIGASRCVDNIPWQNVLVEDGMTGWFSELYLEEYTIDPLS